MAKRSLIGLLAAISYLAPVLVSGQQLGPQNWPQWRGPSGTGVAPNADPPLEWSEQKNVRWKVGVAGKGHSTPIVWGDRIFLLSASPVGPTLEPRYSGAAGAHDNVPVTQRHKFEVVAISRKTGNLLWQKTLNEALPHEGGHYSASLASASPVTDGERLFAFFGTHGLYCLDLNGNLQWHVDFGRMQSKHGHGEGASPALFGDVLIVNWDHEGRSFVVALEKRTGEERWRVPRDEVTSWATPTAFEHQGRAQVVIAGTERVRSYDLNTGAVIWECGGLSANIVASPIYSKGMLFVGSSYEKRALLALRLDGAAGDLTNTKHIAWRRFRGTPYVPSPLLLDDHLYFLTHYQGILTRVDANTGQDRPGAFRISPIRNVYASPVASSDRIYITDLDGATVVISNSEIPRVLAVNQLADNFSASAALVGRELILRGKDNLYCIASPSSDR